MAILKIISDNNASDNNASKTPNQDIDVQATLEMLPYEFYLVGSRYFFNQKIPTNPEEEEEILGKVKYNSDFDKSTDYDYAAQWSGGLHNTLLDIGFIPKLDSIYLDENTVLLYEINNSYGKFQVSLRRSIDLYIKILQDITISYYYHYLWKSNPNNRLDENVHRNRITQDFNLFYKLKGNQL